LGLPCTSVNHLATIKWGDGSADTTVQSVVDCDPPPVANCASADFVVSVRDDPHTYARPGDYAVSFTGPIFIGTTKVDGIVMDDPRSINESLPALTPAVGAAVSGAVATFTDTNPLAQASEFTATINWGDGTTDPATITQPLGQPFQVLGNHVYAHVGS